jgi:hypothetical protein
MANIPTWPRFGGAFSRGGHSSKAPLPAWPTPSAIVSAQVLRPAAKVQRTEPAQMLEAGAGIVYAADAPLAAEDAVIDVVFVDTVA